MEISKETVILAAYFCPVKLLIGMYEICLWFLTFLYCNVCHGCDPSLLWAVALIAVLTFSLWEAEGKNPLLLVPRWLVKYQEDLPQAVCRNKLTQDCRYERSEAVKFHRG